jgi:hypothetical protein
MGSWWWTASNGCVGSYGDSSYGDFSVSKVAHAAGRRAAEEWVRCGSDERHGVQRDVHQCQPTAEEEWVPEVPASTLTHFRPSP